MSRYANPFSLGLRFFCGPVATLGLCALLAAPSARADEPTACPKGGSFAANGALLNLAAPDAQHPLDILAIGSSSTEGVGASSPDHAYPSRLAMELKSDDRLNVNVRNAGVGGEIAEGTLPRLKAALATGWPELVIWQVGTNDALRGVDEDHFRAELEEGVAAARAKSIPLILLDPQFTPSRADAKYERFVRIVDDIGAKLHVPVMARYAMMKTLQTGYAEGVKPFLSPDGLHMNDRGYACLAHSLAAPIAAALNRNKGASL